MPPAAPDDPRHWLALLDAGAWFARLSPALRDALMGAARVRTLAAGQALFRRGDAPCGLYAVLEGAVRVSGTSGRSDDSREVLLTLLEPPHWFGEVSLFDGQPRTHDAVAEGATRLLHVPQPALARLLADAPARWRELGLLMSHKLRLAFVALEEAASLPVAQRLARRLVMMAEGYGVRRDAHQGMHRRSLAVSQEQLSMMLAVSRQTINQNLKELEVMGVLRLNRGGLEITDLPALQRLAGYGPAQAPTGV
ncbi:MAG: Crp/Fnr family transcriptional regulator [Proteobacteria bacterium]|jgi:CRP/FNR family cyclic AMP-dependent transcriptional regulator|nr:Crp/Fnr family transcriptional regulator [Pseudomonadota bacterium]